MNTVFSNNLKKFRNQKNMTQEQAAEALCVGAQTVSRWECGTTLPDVTLLPELARLYGVTIDDFFCETSTAYENYAQRLAFVYEQTRDTEDFLAADLEFKKLQKAGAYSDSDRLLHANIHHLMMCDCRDTALRAYDTVIGNADKSSDTYRKARTARANLMNWIGRSDEELTEQKRVTEANPDDPDEAAYLLVAYRYDGRYEEGFEYFLSVKDKFSSSWRVFEAGGDICRKLKRYDEAFIYWDKALELDPSRIDALMQTASCFEELGDYENAYPTRCVIADWLRKNGYDIRATDEERKAQECLDRMS